MRAIDLAYHVRAGELSLRTGDILLVDPFTFTSGGRPWLNQQWAAQLIFAGAHRLLGWAGVAITYAGAMAVGIRAPLSELQEREGEAANGGGAHAARIHGCLRIARRSAAGTCGTPLHRHLALAGEAGPLGVGCSGPRHDLGQRPRELRPRTWPGRFHPVRRSARTEGSGVRPCCCSSPRRGLPSSPRSAAPSGRTPSIWSGTKRSGARSLSGDHHPPLSLSGGPFWASGRRRGHRRHLQATGDPPHRRRPSARVLRTRGAGSARHPVVGPRRTSDRGRLVRDTGHPSILRRAVSRGGFRRSSRPRSS